MKLRSLVLSVFTILIMCLNVIILPISVFPIEVAAAANNVTLSLNTNSSVVGGSITASGTANTDTSIFIKVLDATNSVVFFDAVKSNDNGNYSDTFTVPNVSPGILTVVAGYGSNVANANLTIAAVSNVTLSLNTNSSVVGGSITASGTANADTSISIKVLDATNSVVFFDVVKSNDNGNYSDTFTVPSVSPGTLTVVAGYGSNVANASLTINPPTVNEAPTVSSAATSTNGSCIVLTMSGALTGSTGTETAFKISGVASNPTVTGVAVSGTSVTLTLSVAVVSTDSPEISYNPTGTNDLTNGTKVAAITNQAVTNNVVALVAPTISPNGGTYTSAQSITIGNIASGDSAYYTTDGSTPTINSHLYSGPITVSQSETVTAAAYDPNSGQWSTTSTPAAFTINQSGGGGADTQAPTWPTGSTLTASNISNNSLTLTWTPATDNVGVTNYQILRDGIVIATVGGTVNTYNATGLVVNHQYNFQVQAGDSVNNWSTTGPSTTATPVWTIANDKTPPYWANGYLVTATPTSYTTAQVVWSAAGDNVGVAAYNVYLWTSPFNTPTLIATLPSTTLSYNLIGLNSQTQYYVSVTAGDAAGNWTQQPTSFNYSAGISIAGTANNGPGLTGAYLTTISNDPNNSSNDSSSTGASVENSNDVPLNPTIKLCFSHAVDQGTVTGSNGSSIDVLSNNQQDITMETAAGVNVPVTVSALVDNFNERQNLFVTPVSPLLSGTAYKIIMSSNLVAKNGAIACIQQEVDFSTAYEITTPTVTVSSDGSNQNLSVTSNTPSNVTMTVPSSVNNATLDVSTLLKNLVSGTVYATSPLPEMTIDAKTTLSSNPLVVSIPAGETISGDTSIWGGSINLPSVQPGNSVAVTPDTGDMISAVNAAVEIGAGSVPLSLSEPVSITIPGMGITGMHVGYVRGTTFTPMTQLSQDSLNGAADGYYYDANNNLVILTTHFTEFVAYTETVGSSTGTGTPPQWPVGSTLSITGNFTAATLTWPAATSNLGVIGYQIGYSVGNGPEQVVATVGSTTLSYNASNFPSAAIWWVNAQGADNSGQSIALTAEGEQSGSGNGATNPVISVTPNKTSDTITVGGSDTLTVTIVPGNATNQKLTWASSNTGFATVDQTGKVTGVAAGSANITATTQDGSNIIANCAVTVTGSGVADTQAPTWPSGSSLTTPSVSQTGLTLTWTAATDNTAVTEYKIYQGSTLLGSVNNNTLSYNVTGLTAGTQYTFQVQAGDDAGNWSTGGPTVSLAPAVPITTSNVTVTDGGSNKSLSVTSATVALATPVTVTVPSNVTDATLDVSSLLNAPVSGTVTTDPLPAMNIAVNTSLSTTTPVQVTIPAGMTVSAGASWSGTINVPTVIVNNSVTVTPDSGDTATVNAAVEVGFGDVPLTLSEPVRILIPGEAGKDAGYTRGGVFTKITNHLTQDSGDSLQAGGDGYINVGPDLVIWTRHFTEFVAYTQTAIPSGGGGGGVDTTPPTWPTGDMVTVALNSTQATLTWTAATDNVGVTSYEILRNNVEVRTVNGSTTTYTDTAVPAGTGGSDTWEVLAFDAAGNVSVAISGQPTTGQNPLDFYPSESGLVTTNLSTSTATDIGPIAGSTSVPVSPTIELVFDRGVDNVGVWTANQNCITLKDSTGTTIPINVFYLTNQPGTLYDTDIFLTPVSNLTPGQTYTITISKNLTANNGKTLGGNDGNTDQTVTFTVAGSGGTGGTGGTPPDTQAPTWTSGSNLTATNLSQTGLTLTWSVAADNTAVTGYKIYQGSKLLGSVGNNTLTYNVTGLTASTPYSFSVQAGDAAGNWSTTGPSTSTTTLAASSVGGTFTEITTTNVTVSADGSNKSLSITNNTPTTGVTITVPSSVTNATISVSSLLNTPISGVVTTSALPAMTITANTSLNATPVQVTIPAGTTVSAATGWNGTIQCTHSRSQ